ncbi:MAG TPA: branched-chain amino acid ABC transporter permease [Actinomycetota bacterium]|nr:branched-chain amino acid ABC transporter permease [Actinomycetota bacterium]
MRVPAAARWGGALAIAVALPLATFAIPQEASYMQGVLVRAAQFALLALGLNVVVGLAGLLDLGYVAFYAIGAYSMAVLSGAGPAQFSHLSFWLILPIGMALAMIAGVSLGLPVLRLRGDYLAIVTLGFGEIIRITASNLDGITRGARGISGIPHPTLFGYEFGIRTLPYYYLTLVLLVAVMVTVRNLDRSRVGRAWVAIREDEVAAEAMGINTLRMKLWAFAIGASTAGLAGVVNASRTNFATPSAFAIIESIFILSMVVLGGMGSLAGPVVGAAAITIVPELLRYLDLQEYRFLLFGAVLVVMMIYRPEGLVPSKRVAAEQQGLGVAGEEKTGAEVAEVPVASEGGDDDPS